MSLSMIYTPTYNRGMSDTYSSRLQAAIDRARTSQYRLSRDSGVSQPTISRIIKGVSANPEKETLGALADALGVSRAWLILGEGPMDAEDARKDRQEFSQAERAWGHESEFHRRVEAIVEADDEQGSAMQKRFGMSAEQLAELEFGENSPGVSDWMYAAVGMQAPKRKANSSAENVVEGPCVQGRVPLISWVQAGNWAEAVVPMEIADAEQWIECPFAHSDLSYALKVVGISMHPEFVEGDIIIVDPTRPHDPGKYVIARKPDTNEATFKQLFQEGSEFYLKAINPDWPKQIIPLNEGWVVSAVVIGKMKTY